MAPEERNHVADGPEDELWRPGGAVKAGKILVVDDDEVVAGVFKLQLEAVGFAVTTSIDAQQGFGELVAAIGDGCPFDLLITDFVMPGNRGNVLVRAVRELEDDDLIAEERRLPILLLTGMAPSGFLQREQDDLMRAGVYYLSKEDAVDRLIPTAKKILRA